MFKIGMGIPNVLCAVRPPFKSVAAIPDEAVAIHFKFFDQYILNSSYEFDEDEEDDEDELLRHCKKRSRRPRAVQCSKLLRRSVTGTIHPYLPIFNL